MPIIHQSGLIPGPNPQYNVPAGARTAYLYVSGTAWAHSPGPVAILIKFNGVGWQMTQMWANNAAVHLTLPTAVGPVGLTNGGNLIEIAAGNGNTVIDQNDQFQIWLTD